MKTLPTSHDSVRILTVLLNHEAPNCFGAFFFDFSCEMRGNESDIRCAGTFSCDVLRFEQGESAQFFPFFALLEAVHENGTASKSEQDSEHEMQPERPFSAQKRHGKSPAE